MSEPLITVIVPVYKVEQYLEKCVESIRNQTHRNLEIILVDDGSPDRCGEMCDTFAKEDSRIRVIHKENGGQASARNMALDICTGEYITFVDSDDWLTIDACEVMLRTLQDGNAEISLCSLWGYELDGTLTTPKETSILCSKVINRDEALWMLTENSGVHFSVVWSKLYCKDLFQGLRFPEGRIHEDVYILHHLFGTCKKVAIIPTQVYYRARRDSTMNASYNIKRMDDAAAAYWDRYVYLKEQGYSRYAKVALNNCCGVLSVGLQKLSVRENEAIFRVYIQRMLRYNVGLRCIKMLLLLIKNYFKM